MKVDVTFFEHVPSPNSLYGIRGSRARLYLQLDRYAETEREFQAIRRDDTLSIAYRLYSLDPFGSNDTVVVTLPAVPRLQAGRFEADSSTLGQVLRDREIVSSSRGLGRSGLTRSESCRIRPEN